MYKHLYALLEDEITETQTLPRKSRQDIAGLVQMNGLLATGKTCAEEALRVARHELEEMKQVGSPPCILSIKLVAEQCDYLRTENQRLLRKSKTNVDAG